VNGIERLAIRDESGGTVVGVKATPGASRDRIVGVLGDALKIATAAPPEKGKANAAVKKILAKALGVAPRDIELVRGSTSPHKEFRVADMTRTVLRKKLSDIP
jgi:uncharacterized protein (TIGR00251 family)